MASSPMFNWRLYRAGLLPVLLAIAIAAFSLGARPSPLGSSLAPDAFDGARAFAELGPLASRFRDRRPGSAGDDELASYVTSRFRAVGAGSKGGFRVRTSIFEGETIDGMKELESVIAEHAGVGSGAPIVIFAHRDAVGPSSRAQLSGTAVLLALARVLANSETQRTIILVSTSGGSGGSAGAIDFATRETGPFDAAIVLGDLASTRVGKPIVVPYSDGYGGAPDVLERTLDQALAQELGLDPGGLSVPGQIAHLVFPLTVGEQGALNERGVPAVLVQVSGEQGAKAGQALSETRLQHSGSAVLGAIYALDAGPEVAPRPSEELLVQRKVIPSWAVRLLVGALLLSPLLLAIDALARLRREGEREGPSLLWALSLSLPFLLCAIFVRGLGLTRMLASPATPLPADGLRLSAASLEATIASALVLCGGWLAWRALARGAKAREGRSMEADGVASVLVLVLVALIVWAINPFAALLLLPAAHLAPGLLSLDPSELSPRVRFAGALAMLALSLAPLGLISAYYAHELGLGLPQLAFSALLLVSGGHVSLLGALLWSLALSSFIGAASIALRGDSLRGDSPRGELDELPITTRGPLGYAGPGSLGGTESALRR